MLFNRERADIYMRQCGLDVLIASSPVNITYFTGYTCWIDPLFKTYMMSPGASSDLAQGYAVYALDAEPAFISAGSLMAVNAIDLWVRDILVFGAPGLDTSLPVTAFSEQERRIFDLLTAAPRHDTATGALASALRDRELSDARIGLEMEGLQPGSLEEINRLAPDADIRDASNLIRLIRMVKSPEEIALLTRAAEIAEQAAMEGMELLRPGRPMHECVRQFRARLGALEADMDHFAFGYRGMGIATEPTYMLQEDTVEYVDWGCKYRQYFSDTGTTLAMNPMSPELQRRFDALCACLEAGVAAVRPGVKASDVQASMAETLKGYGITDMFPHGHGVGLEVRDYPIIVPDNGLRIRDGCIDMPSDLSLEVDVALNLETPLFIPGVASLHLETSVVVTPDGSRRLAPHNRRTPVIPGA